ncbi:MAG: hypothetical protein ACTSVI_01825 [Promethearchaeota archaeon]
MNKIEKLAICIGSFIGAAILIDILTGLVLADNSLGLALLANFPGQTQSNFLDRYSGYITTDTLGWFTYIFSFSAQNLEILAGLVRHGDTVGLIPIMIEFNPNSTPDIFPVYLMYSLKLIIPMFAVAIVSGIVSKSKKEALTNSVFTYLIIGIGAIVLNIIHVAMNWVSVGWKFSATLELNPVFAIVWYSSGLLTPDMTMYIIGISITMIVFALVNGLTTGIISLLIALKK